MKPFEAPSFETVLFTVEDIMTESVVLPDDENEDDTPIEEF